MKRLILSFLTVCFLIIHYNAIAGKSKTIPFRDGFVVFHNQDTLRCKLRFTRKVSEGLIQVQRENYIDILTVKDVRSFSYYDETIKKSRTFVNVAFIPNLSTRKHELFVELIYGNEKLTIVNHKTLGYSTNAIQFNPFRSKTIVNNRYILDNQTGKVVPMSKEEVLRLMKSEEREVSSYIQTSGFRMKRVEEFIAVLDYYATL